MGATTVARAESVGLQGQRTRHGLDLGARGGKLPAVTAKHFSIKVTFGESEDNADAGHGWQGDFPNLAASAAGIPALSPLS